MNKLKYTKDDNVVFYVDHCEEDRAYYIHDIDINVADSNYKAHIDKQIEKDEQYDLYHFSELINQQFPYREFENTAIKILDIQSQMIKIIFETTDEANKRKNKDLDNEIKNILKSIEHNKDDCVTFYFEYNPFDFGYFLNDYEINVLDKKYEKHIQNRLEEAQIVYIREIANQQFPYKSFKKDAYDTLQIQPEMIKIIFETTNPWETQISKPKADMKPFDVGLTK